MKSLTQQIEDNKQQQQIEDIFLIKLPQNNQIIDIRQNFLFQKYYIGLYLLKKEECANRYQRDWKSHHINFWKAVQFNQSQSLKQLIKLSETSLYPINVDSLYLNNFTAMHIAAANGFLDILEVLHQYKANLNAQTKEKRTPLHLACQNNHLLAVEFLCRLGCLINEEDKEFNTPLHLASIKGNFAIVKFLANLNQIKICSQNQKYETPYDSTSSIEIRKFFQTNQKFINQYKISNHSYFRIQIQKQNFTNSKADHINKFLYSKQKELSQQQQQQVQQQCIFLNEISLVSNNMGKKNLICLSPNHFKPIQLLGIGGFSQVFLVILKEDIVEILKTNKLYDSIYQKYYAIKILNKQQYQSILKYALYEKNILVFIQHPFIIKLYFTFQSKNNLMLGLQYCPGGNLFQIIKKKYNKGMPEKFAILYISEIVLALEFLHQKFIIYRDLKPENVLFDQQGHVILSDFGLSKEFINNNLTKTQVGTPMFFSPEIVQKKGHDKMYDWYQLGVLLYFMVTGSFPFNGKTKEILKANIVIQQLNFPSEIALSNEMKDFISRLMAKQSCNRLGFLNDAQEIKSHIIFKEIDWKEVEERKLKMPKIQKLNKSTKSSKLNCQMKDIFNQNANFDVSNWNFIKTNQ